MMCLDECKADMIQIGQKVFELCFFSFFFFS